MRAISPEFLTTKFLQTLALRDLNGVCEMIAEDAILVTHTRMLPKGTYNKESFRVALARIFRSNDDPLNVEIGKVVVTGNQVTAETIWHSPVGGRHYQGKYFILVEIRGGKIVHFLSATKPITE